ncbi:hypothetical protein EHZ19_31790 [Paraburkholderia bannensis]|nr:hypothetical protein [Paraburkholderia bannensis]RQM43886.1 hypothetical protein EHZ19_31790 [Paraburkholderia bannensis]
MKTKTQNLATGDNSVALHTITAEPGDRIIVDTPNGATLLIAVDAGIISFHRAKDVREGSVAIVAPLLNDDAAEPTAVSYAENVNVNPMEEEDDTD